MSGSTIRPIVVAASSHTGLAHPRNLDLGSLPDLMNFEDRYKALEEAHVESDERNPIETPYRLPGNVIPFHYWVQLESSIHAGDRAFKGKVDLYFNVSSPTRRVYVHNRGLDLEKAELYIYGAGAEPEKILLDWPRYEFDYRREFIIFSSRINLIPGVSYILCLEFEGNLRLDQDGFYVATYQDDQGEERYYAVTQFQAISARTAFPCFDEPALKVTIDLELIHSQSYSAVSNMPVSEEFLRSDGFQLTRFQRTPVMSVYLMAFMISDFEYREEGTQRIFARPNAIDETEFALAAGVATLQAFDEYTGIPYSTYMPKMDQVAVTDFSAGAMENWGLCKYQEQYLLDDPEKTTFRTRTFIATIIAHEYAHQWFGNKVTTEWWSYLWLNEGFATFYEFYAANLAAPHMEYFEMFNLNVVHWALYADGQEGTRPMSYSRGATNSLIGSLFDSVAYDKAGSVVNMFRGVLGDDAWREMLQIYLSGNGLQSVNPTLLANAMEQVADDLDILPDGVSMADFVNSWTEQAGYPVLNVRRNYVSNEIIISQERYFNDFIEANGQQTWIVPYNLVNQSFADFNDLSWIWLTGRAVRLSTNVQDDRWVIVNKRQVGFYRVNYDVRNWYLIIDALVQNWASVHRLNRAQLLDDSFELARSNRLDMEVCLDLMEYLRDELEYPPWTAASSILSYFHNRVRGTEQYDGFARFVHTIIARVYGTLEIDSVGDEESNLHKYLKQTISTWACSTGQEDCLTRTRNLLQETAESEGTVHPDIAAVTYCYGLRDSTKRTFVFVYDLLKTSTNKAHRNLLIDSLGCSNDQEELRAFLYTAVGGDIQVNFTMAERRRILSAVAAGSRDGVDALIDFLVDAYGYVISTNNEAELERLEFLIETLGPRFSQTEVNRARETAARNLEWPSTREGLIVASFLENHYPAETVSTV
ncbi:aminopeptidase N [Culex quinquefasciatus]|uniref:Aminopeptidase n=1 Tax=Culex quinquefasciatus TaxID=7176 RepID=B0WAF6_CULQU|nr:aminopeptidase N [Culex quinquefasciatus]|eukprot:XP_001845690.1 aminopeptidase N [Culex quinquefasciatus]